MIGFNGNQSAYQVVVINSKHHSSNYHKYTCMTLLISLATIIEAFLSSAPVLLL